MLKKYFKKIKWNKKLFASSFLWLGLLMIVLDLASKWTVELLLEEGEPVTVIKNFFYITLSHNTGAAWSLGAGKIGGRIIFILISLIMSFVFYMIWRNGVEKESKWMNASLMLVWGGAVGNLIDRACYFWEKGSGMPYGVIDFLQFYLGGGPSAPSNAVLNPFPSFNVADASLVVGIAMMIIIMVIRMVKESIEKDKEFAKKNSKNVTDSNNENKE